MVGLTLLKFARSALPTPVVNVSRAGATVARYTSDAPRTETVPCTPCPADTYWVFLRWPFRPECRKCPDNKFSPPGSVELQDCTLCPNGYGLVEGVSTYVGAWLDTAEFWEK